MDNINLKKCKFCGENKLLSEFEKNNNKKDGVSGECKKCKAYKAKLYRANNREKVLNDQKIQNLKQKNKIKEFVYFKYCSHDSGCGKNKYRDEFSIENGSKTGLSTICKLCQQIQRKNKPIDKDKKTPKLEPKG